MTKAERYYMNTYTRIRRGRRGRNCIQINIGNAGFMLAEHWPLKEARWMQQQIAKSLVELVRTEAGIHFVGDEVIDWRLKCQRKTTGKR